MGGGRSLVLPVYHMGISGIQPGDFSHLHLFENRSDCPPTLGEHIRGICIVNSRSEGGMRGIYQCGIHQVGGWDVVSKEIKQKF